MCEGLVENGRSLEDKEKMSNGPIKRLFLDATFDIRPFRQHQTTEQDKISYEEL